MPGAEVNGSSANGANANASAGPKFNKDRLDKMRAFFDGYVQRDDLAGMLALVNCHGQDVFRESIGYFDKEAKTPMPFNAIFRIMSMTKPICAVAAMMLLEEGNFTLNSPVSQFIPEFATMKVFVKENADGTIETEPLKTPVTIRHLMTHTSGMPYGFSPIEVIDRLFIAQREKSLKANGGPKNSAEVVADLIEVPLAFQPGTKWRYGMNIEVLGRIVEIISGKNLGEFCKERIFEPLGMVDTDFFCPPEKLDRVVPIYAHAMDPKTFQKVPGAPLTRKEPLWPLSTSDPAFHSGGGGLCSTLDDYAKFAQMMVNGGQLNGKRFLSPTTVALWSENHTPLEALPYQFPTRPVQYGKGYSLATYVVMDPAMNGIQTPKGSYSWSGAWSTHMWIDPSNKLYGVLLMHHDPAGYYETDNQFQQLTYAAME